VGIESISVVIPVYNGARTLPEVLARLYPVLSVLGRPFEVLLVNDGSTDGSRDVVTRLAGRWPDVRGVNLLRNYGQHNALLCGIRLARHEVVVTLDDDLQHPPEEIPRLLARLAEGCDVVYGTPKRERHGFWRGLASSLTRWALQTAMGTANARKVSAFRAFRTRLRDAFANFRSPFVFLDALLTWGAAADRFAAVPVRHDPRPVGQSNYTFGKLVATALNMMTGYTTLPLRVASAAGFASMLFGLGVLLFVVGRYLWQGSSVAGFPFLASIIAIFAGMQLFVLGTIGEYLARMHFRMMDRPAYVVEPVGDAPSVPPRAAEGPWAA
jgi:undecaprenyl-phosphate 4-deoxy-4-formamido-L-arabinose transferase